MTLIYFTLLLLPEGAQYEPDHRGYAQGSHGLVFHRFLDIGLKLFDSLLCLLAVVAGLLGDLASNFLCALGDVFHLVGGDVGHFTKPSLAGIRAALRIVDGVSGFLLSHLVSPVTVTRQR